MYIQNVFLIFKNLLKVNVLQHRPVLMTTDGDVWLFQTFEIACMKIYLPEKTNIDTIVNVNDTQKKDANLVKVYVYQLLIIREDPTFNFQRQHTTCF